MVAATALSAVLTANTAVISWSAEQVAATGTGQISTNGTLQEAAYLGKSSNGLANKTIGGVTFQPGTSTAGVEALNYIEFPVSGSYDGFYATGNPDMAGILGGGKYGSSIGTAITFANLIVGKQYEIQLFVADMRNHAGYKDRTLEIDGELLANSCIGLGGDGYGTVATGTFTADATSFDVIINLRNAYLSTYDAGFQLNAYQIREVVPEPATIGLLGASSVILLMIRRRFSR